MAGTADAPLWRQVLDDLERRLASGEIGERFPTDRELVERYDVSRHTVREAVRHLKARGVIERHRGRGSTVTAPGLVQPLGSLYSLFAAVEDAGHHQSSEVLQLAATTDEAAAARFGLGPDAELVVLARRRLVDGEPLALDTAHLPHDVGAPLLGVDFTHTSLYGEMARRCGLVPDAGEERLTPVVPDDGLREALDLGPDDAVLRLDRLSWFEGRPVECRVTLLRSDRFAFVSRWPEGRTVADLRG